MFIAATQAIECLAREQIVQQHIETMTNRVSSVARERPEKMAMLSSCRLRVLLWVVIDGQVAYDVKVGAVHLGNRCVS